MDLYDHQPYLSDHQPYLSDHHPSQSDTCCQARHKRKPPRVPFCVGSITSKRWKPSMLVSSSRVTQVHYLIYRILSCSFVVYCRVLLTCVVMLFCSNFLSSNLQHQCQFKFGQYPYNVPYLYNVLYRSLTIRKRKKNEIFFCIHLFVFYFFVQLVSSIILIYYLFSILNSLLNDTLMVFVSSNILQK